MKRLLVHCLVAYMKCEKEEKRVYITILIVQCNIFLLQKVAGKQVCIYC